jgi:hypothetical protein
MNTEKINFIKITFPSLLKSLKGDEIPVWGKMNAQQMIEHMTDSFRIEDEKNIQIIHTPAEQLKAYKDFLMSEKEFKPNTKNNLMAETPPQEINDGIQKAIEELETEIDYFINYFKDDPMKITTNPFFGLLNFDEWVQLLHKHAVHHLKQFRLL